MFRSESTAGGQPDRQVRPAWWKKIVKRLALLAVTLLLLAAGAETATRLLTDTAPLMVRDPATGSHYIAGFQGEVYVPEVDRRIRLRFNRVGFRGPDRPFEKPEGVRRIAVVGDSFVAAVSVEEEETMVCRLEAMLNRSHPGVRWEVLNFGVSGSGTGQELLLYQRLVHRFEPDVVLCAFFVGNDLSDNCNRLSSQPRIYYDLDEQGHLHQVPFSPNRARASALLNRYSRFYVWQKGLFRRARNNLRAQIGQLANGDWVFCRKEPEDVARAWKITGELLKAFRREVESRGSLFAVVLLPSPRQIYKDYFQDMLELTGELAGHFDPEYPEQRLGALCREAGIPLLTMIDDFRQAAPSASIALKQDQLYNGGAGHFNRRANAIATRAVHRFLTQAGTQRVAGRPLVAGLR